MIFLVWRVAAGGEVEFDADLEEELVGFEEVAGRGGHLVRGRVVAYVAGAVTVALLPRLAWLFAEAWSTGDAPAALSATEHEVTYGVGGAIVALSSVVAVQVMQGEAGSVRELALCDLFCVEAGRRIVEFCGR